MKTALIAYTLILLILATLMGVFTPRPVITPMGTRQVVIIDWVKGQCYLPYK